MIFLIPSAFEAKAILEELSQTRMTRDDSGARWYNGQWEGISVVVGEIGMGSPHAARRAAVVLDQAALNGPVVLAGFGGALDDGWSLGQITLHAPHCAMLSPELIRRLPPHQQVKIHTAREVVATPEQKRSLFERTGCPVVDMETDDVEAVCRERGRHLLTVRAISDTVHDAVPTDILSRSYDQDQGRYTPVKLAGHLTRHPFGVRRLTQFIAPLPAVRKQMTAFLKVLMHESQALPW
jgi:nucleoside phosphorylase